MFEYIKREAALMKLMQDGCNAKNLQSISDIPAADVAPVVHGRWTDGDPICPVCGGDKFKDLDADIWCDWKPPCCPNCGAKMDGGDNTERRAPGFL